MLIWLSWLTGAYVLGSVSFALMLGKLNGINIREHGSGNVGATNVGRALGKKWGITCFFLDLSKGLIPVLGYWMTRMMVEAEPQGAAEMLKWLAIGVAAILGHVFPAFLKFKGGKGMATSLGALLGFWPILTVPALASFLVWAVVTKLTAYVGLGSVIAAAALPLFVVGFALATGYDTDEIAVCGSISAMLALLVIIRHKSNIKRLLDGTEDKVNWAKRKRDRQST